MFVATKVWGNDLCERVCESFETFRFIRTTPTLGDKVFKTQHVSHILEQVRNSFYKSTYSWILLI